MAGSLELLISSGAIIVGIIDKLGGVIKPEGYSFQEVKSLLINRSSNYLEVDEMISFKEVNEKIWSVGSRNICSSCAPDYFLKIN